MRTNFAVVLFGAFALSLCTLSASTTTTYGTAYLGPAGPATPYSIDSTTRAETPVGLAGFNRVGEIYGIGTDPLSGDFNELTINTTTGLAMAAGPLAVSRSLNGIADMSFRSDGTLYAIDGFNRTYTINTTTGAAKLIGGGPGAAGGNALAFSLSDILYRVDDDEAWSVDQANGSGTSVTDMNYPNPPRASNPGANGMGYAGSTAGLTNSLTNIDVSNGGVTVIEQTMPGLNALAVAPARPASVPDVMSTLWLALPLGIMLFLARRTSRCNSA